MVRASLVIFAVALALSTFCAGQSAADVYKAKCAACHGTGGAGDTTVGRNMKVRDLSSDDVQKQSDAELTTIIKNGKGKMPKYEGKLTDQQITDLVKYIRTLKK